ncbi:uncharacterized protein LOC128244306 [Mya arenaria]|uniref:uncharacterized protein LOC128244306 n=1 Tax=Mya arenaria TaxID=6604 RepID=UPI0022DF3E52|nr:uncharacterized protein LOC128244306 [Mya arenaria]
MKGYIFLFLVATAFCQATAQGTDGLTAKAAEETDEETDIDIKDENGNLVTQAEIFSDVDFQVEKPVEGSVCLIKNKNDTSECYKEKPLTFEIPSSVWAFCEGREMTVLEAIECADKQGQERNFIDEILHRRAKGQYRTVCLWTRRDTVTCAAKRCCKYKKYSRKCLKTCCKQYKKNVISTERCIKGFTTRF